MSRDEGPGRDGPYGNPKLQLGFVVLVGLSRCPSTSNGLRKLVRKAPGNAELGPAGVVSAVAMLTGQGLEKTVFYVCYTGYPVQPHADSAF